MSKLAFELIITCLWISSVNTEIELKVSKPNFLGVDFLKEPINTYFSSNRISMETGITECPD
jgi:hypothetical protein